DMLGQKDPQPGHMRDYVSTTADNGGVHVNSGIPNHAFFLIATTLSGNAWEKAGRIWYETIRDPRLRPTVGFQTFAATTVRVAGPAAFQYDVTIDDGAKRQRVTLREPALPAGFSEVFRRLLEL